MQGTERGSAGSPGSDPDQMSRAALQGQQVETGASVGLNQRGQCAILTQGSQRLPLLGPGTGLRCLELGYCPTTQGLLPEGPGGRSVERRWDVVPGSQWQSNAASPRLPSSPLPRHVPSVLAWAFLWMNKAPICLPLSHPTTSFQILSLLSSAPLLSSKKRRQLLVASGLTPCWYQYLAKREFQVWTSPAPKSPPHGLPRWLRC